jgi:NADPH-dependent glutamate synthase beta subunit-like oxidoreductase
MVKLKIDGVDVEVSGDAMLLEAIRRAGVYIPTLCHHPNLNPQGACRLCIVEIEGVEGVQTSCTYPVRDGLVVYTNTEKLRELRKEILSLILERHPNACILCPQREGCSRTQCSTNVPEEERCCPVFDVCEFRRVVEYVGIDEPVKYTPRGIKPLEEHFFLRDPELCIVCGRCVRICKDVIGANILDFVEKSSSVTVSTAYNLHFAEIGCRFDGCCVEVCPTGALRDKVRRWEEPPCDPACPLGYEPSKLVYLAGKERFEEIAEEISLFAIPLIVSHICPAPCESECRRGELNQPISIRAIERFSLEEKFGLVEVGGKEKGKRIAVIGSGPAGLACSHWLALMGYGVTVFEASEIGGSLNLIPNFKLPKETIEREVERLKKLGVEFKVNFRADPKELKDSGFDAVVVAIGRGKPLRAEARLKEVMSELKRGKVKFRSAAIFGGAEALDAARALARAGVKVYLNLKEQQHLDEVRMAEEEGVRIVNELKVNQTPSGYEIEADGKKDEVERLLLQDYGVEETGLRIKNERIDVRSNFETSEKGIFAAGSAVIGEMNVANILANAKRVAFEVDRYLGGSGLEIKRRKREIDFKLGRIEGFAELERVRLKEFLSKEEVTAEAVRCLRCELRPSLEGVPLPPEEYLELTSECLDAIPEAEGVVKLYDGEKNIIYIKGTENIRELLKEYLDDPEAKFFAFEEDKMFTKRESELIQEFLQKHGRMPKYNDELEDLF